MANPRDVFGVIGFAVMFPPLNCQPLNWIQWKHGILGLDEQIGGQGVSPLCSGCCLEHAEKKTMEKKRVKTNDIPN